jgi:hypothetical protein
MACASFQNSVLRNIIHPKISTSQSISAPVIDRRQTVSGAAVKKHLKFNDVDYVISHGPMLDLSSHFQPLTMILAAMIYGW